MSQDKYNREESEPEDLSPKQQQEADDYLSKLAQSILKKEKGPSPAPASSPAPGSTATPPPVSPSSRPDVIKQPAGTRPVQPDPKTPAHAAADWVREVTMVDENGRYMPGTILLFEDGSVGIYKETIPQKNYDIVYILKENGRAAPQGMPLFTYDLRPIGRLPWRFLEQVIRTSRWERDPVIFHLLKYPDTAHIPAIVPTDSVSGTAIPRMTESQVEERPKLTKGRKIRIQFGENRSWDAVYFGQDELGHVVAHDTHGTWSVMHLDLDKFRDTITFQDIVPDDVMRKIEEDCMKGA